MVKIAFIPAKGHSERIPGKNFKKLNGCPLFLYSVQAAKDSGIFDRIIVVSDMFNLLQDLPIRYYYELFEEPTNLTHAPDIEWLQYCRKFIDEMDFFAILRPTNPFRTGETIKRAWRELMAEVYHGLYADSIRAMEIVKQHPGKMWLHRFDFGFLFVKPLVKQKGRSLATYNAPTQSLPKVYVQNASLEIGRVENLDHGSVSGEKILPFFTEGYEGFDINYPEDWILAEALVERGLAKLPEIK